MNTNIKKWIISKGLHKSNADQQRLKLLEELGELSFAVNTNNQDEIIDAIGDLYVASNTLAMQLNIDLNYDLSIINYNSNFQDSRCRKVMILMNVVNNVACNTTKDSIYLLLDCLNAFCQNEKFTLNECVEHAWNEIKDRKNVLTT